MILEGYGLTETSPVASFNHPGRVRKPGSIGTPVEGVQMRVVESETGGRSVWVRCQRWTNHSAATTTP